MTWTCTCRRWRDTQRGRRRRTMVIVDENRCPFCLRTKKQVRGLRGLFGLAGRW